MTYTPYTVGILRAALDGLSDDLPVILSRDEEGNAFRQLSGVEVSACADFGSYDPEPIHPDDLDDYELDDLTDVVILWP